MLQLSGLICRVRFRAETSSSPSSLSFVSTVTVLVSTFTRDAKILGGFANEAAFLNIPERTYRIEFVEGVRPDYVSVQVVHGLENSAISPLDGSAGQAAQ